MKTYITKRVEEGGVKVASVVGSDWDGIQEEAASHYRSRVTVEDWSEARELSEQQLKWWKGVLLPSLAKHTGDSIAYWETKLKLAVLPDDFEPVTIRLHGKFYTYVPSIAGLSMKKMNILVEGSVDHLHDKTIYGDEFTWVTLPNPELRADKKRG